MAWTIPIAAIGGEGIFWLVVVIFVIISKIIQAGKKNASPTQESNLPDSSSSSSPEEELRDFLKRLTQGGEEEYPMPAPRPHRPVSVAPSPLPTHTTRATASSQKSAERIRQSPSRPQAPRIQPTPPRPVVIQRAPSPIGMKAMTETPCVTVSSSPAIPPVNKQRNVIVTALGDWECLREAIVLREILGPPLAMRREKTHAFAG